MSQVSIDLDAGESLSVHTPPAPSPPPPILAGFATAAGGRIENKNAVGFSAASTSFAGFATAAGGAIPGATANGRSAAQKAACVAVAAFARRSFLADSDLRDILRPNLASRVRLLHDWAGIPSCLDG